MKKMEKQIPGQTGVYKQDNKDKARNKPIDNHPVLGHIYHDDVGVILGTGYNHFSSPLGIHGLCKMDGKGRLDLLVVVARNAGTGQFKKFMLACMKSFKTICIWQIWNMHLEQMLLKNGFTPDTEITKDREVLKGLRWDKK